MKESPAAVARVSVLLLPLALLLPTPASCQVAFTTCNAVRPAAPKSVMAISALNEAVDLMWETPANKPCNVIYEVSVQPGGDAVNVTQQRASVTGLSNGVQYTFTIRVSFPAKKNAFLQPSGSRRCSTAAAPPPV
jgi:chitodextrinase